MLIDEGLASIQVADEDEGWKVGMGGIVGIAIGLGLMLGVGRILRFVCKRGVIQR
jgi:hypothetical protein